MSSVRNLATHNRDALLRHGRLLEGATLGWNVIGIVVLAAAAWSARSVALAGFGLDSLIEIGASTVVLWELSNSDSRRQRVALRLIGYSFALLALYLLVQAGWAIAQHHVAGHSPGGIAWAGATVPTMLALAYGKHQTGVRLANPVLMSEAKVTCVDAALAAAVLMGLVLNSWLGWWWADPVAGLVLVGYAANEARTLLRSTS